MSDINVTVEEAQPIEVTLQGVDLFVDKDFVSLTDTPSSYAGMGGEFVRVKLAEDGLEFIASSANVDELTDVGDVTITSVTTGEILKWDGAAWVNNTLAEASIDTVHSNRANLDVIDQNLATTDNVEFATVKTKQIAAISIPNPEATTSVPLGPWKDVSATISKIRYFALPSGSTVDFNIEERGSTTPGTAGTNVLSADVTASSTPAETTSFANASIGADANLHLECSAITGTPADLVVVVYGKED